MGKEDQGPEQVQHQQGSNKERHQLKSLKAYKFDYASANTQAGHILITETRSKISEWFD